MKKTKALFDKDVLIFKALSDPLRLELLRIIQKKERVCVCELSEKISIQQSKLSYHLKLLLKADLISVFPDGKWNFYSIRMNILRQYVTENFTERLFSK